MIGSNVTNGFEQFSAAVDRFFSPNDKSIRSDFSGNDTGTVGMRNRAGMFFNNVVDFMNATTLHGTKSQFSTKFDFSSDENKTERTMCGFESLATMEQVLKDLCHKCDITDPTMCASTVKTLGTIINRYADASETIAKHWATSGVTNKDMSGAHEFYGSDSSYVGGSDFSFTPSMPGMEAFGANMDTVLPDIRAAMTIALLKPHRGITERIFHKRTIAHPVIRYTIAFDELFDLNKAADVSGKVRNAWDHRIPMIVLYRQPNQINFTPSKIIAKKVKDLPGNFIASDGLLKFGRDIDLFDLAMVDTEVRTRPDHTSFVADNTTLEAIHCKIKNKTSGVTEDYILNVAGNPNSRLLMMENMSDSGDRGTIMIEHAQFYSKTLDSTQNPSVIFAPVVDDVMIYLKLRVSATINRKTSVTHADISHTFEARATRDGVTIPNEILDLVKELEFTSIGYQINACYSEDNVRMSSLIVRNNIYTKTYELPTTRNFMYDHAMNEPEPEGVMEKVNNLQQLGCDDRNLSIIKRLFEHVYTIGLKQKNDPAYRKNTDNATLNQQYAAGSRVNPTILMKKIKLSDHVESIRTSDAFGDLRQFVDSYMTKICSDLHVQSLYVNMLDHGERPTYKVVTSVQILENLLCVPHIHNHLMPNGMAGEQLYGESKITGSEYKRVLPSGVELQCLPCTFDYMDKSILIIPFRPSRPESEFNFAHNYDFGTFAAHYMPQINQGNHKRMLVNIREYPVPTNPIGIWITIEDLETFLPDVTK